MNNIDKNSIIRTLLLGAFLILFMVAGSQTIGLSRKGFDFNVTNLALSRFFFYIAPAISYLIGIIILFIVELIITKGDSSYGNSLAFNSPGESPSLEVDLFKGGFKVFLFSLILFSALGLYGAINHQTFTGVGTLENQFSPTDELLYSSLLIPAAENLGSAFIIAFLIFGIRWLARKNEWDSGSFKILAWVSIPFVTAVYGVLNHLLRYSSSDVALMSVFIFWFVGGLLTITTGSFYSFWVLHICNNLFFSLGGLFASDNIIIGTVVVEIMLIALFLYLFVFRRKSKQFKSEEIY